MSILISKEHGLNPMIGQCPICGGDANELFILGRLKGDTKAPVKGVVPGMSQPCDTCKDNMAQGFMLVECKDGTDPNNPYRTGQIWVLKREAVETWGIDMSKGMVFIEESYAREIGLEKGEVGVKS